MEQATRKPLRWPYLVVGVIAMLFAGIIYAWSILKAPLGEAFGWSASGLTLNFTLTMCFFCLGGLVASLLNKKIGPKASVILAGVLAAAGFILASLLDGSSIVLLYLCYGLLAGLGIGMAYNVVISTVSAWFPDKSGFCSGCLMMGFGASTLVLGNLAGSWIESLGWQRTYLILGIALGVVLILTGLILRRPGAEVTLPQPKAKSNAKGGEAFQTEDMPTGKMVRRFTFWRAFLALAFLAAVGNSVISFARDLTLSLDASATLATTLVGVLSVCNGLGRIATGALFDAAGRRTTMLLGNLITIGAAAVTLVAVLIHSLPLCVVGLCLTGLAYGSCPTISSAFTSAFYGTKFFATNFSIMNFNLMAASFLATASSALLTSFSSYLAPFIMLLALSVVALVLTLSIRRP